MKKSLFFTVIYLLVLFSVVSLPALDVMVGVKSGYFNWRPYYKDLVQSGMSDIENGSGMLYGPVVSVVINPKWSFSATGLFGIQSSHWSLEGEDMNWGPQVIAANTTWTADTQRVDLDFAVSYRLSNHFRVFAGYKYQHMESDYRATLIASGSGSGDDSAWDGGTILKTPAHGPALGFGYSTVLGEFLFFSSNLSGIYMFSSVEWEDNVWEYFQPDAADSFTSETFEGPVTKLDTFQAGINFEPSFGVSLDNNWIVTLGGRFQWMYIKFIDDPFLAGARVAPDHGLHDFIYGGFISILYAF